MARFIVQQGFPPSGSVPSMPTWDVVDTSTQKVLESWDSKSQAQSQANAYNSGALKTDRPIRPAPKMAAASPRDRWRPLKSGYGETDYRDPLTGEMKCGWCENAATHKIFWKNDYGSGGPIWTCASHLERTKNLYTYASGAPRVESV